MNENILVNFIFTKKKIIKKNHQNCYFPPELRNDLIHAAS